MDRLFYIYQALGIDALPFPFCVFNALSFEFLLQFLAFILGTESLFYFFTTLVCIGNFHLIPHYILLPLL